MSQGPNNIVNQLYCNDMKTPDVGGTLSLTQERQKNGVVVRHHKQVDTVQSRAGLQVAERLPQVAVLGTVTHKHLEEETNTRRRFNVNFI